MTQAMQVFIGSLFGDGNLFPSAGKWVHYSEIHSLKQKDYLLWKMKLMSKKFNFAGSPYIFNKYDERTNKIYNSVKINISDAKKLNKYYNIFYKNRIKIIPKQYLYKLNRLGLAVWYQDDGYYSYGRYSCALSLNSFTRKENLLILKFLRDKFDIKGRLSRHNDKAEFYGIDAERLLEIVKEYVHPTMTYKLGHLDKNNENKIIRAKETISKNKKEYYLKNRNNILIYQKHYRFKNKRRIRTYRKVYYENNKGRLNSYKKEWFKRHGRTKSK